MMQELNKWKNAKWKYWTLTIKDCNWKPPGRIEKLSNIKYIRGQLEFSKSQYLYWKIAIQYFEPIGVSNVRDQFSKEADVEPIYSQTEWNYVWNENSFCKGTQFELGDNSDMMNTISTRKSGSEVNPFVVETQQKLDINDLEKKLINIAENLYFLPNKFLEILWNIVQNVEMDEIIDTSNLKDFDKLLDVESPNMIDTLKTNLEIPKNQGKDQDIQELEKLVQLIHSTNLEDYDEFLEMESQDIAKSLGLVTPPSKRTIDFPKNHGKKWQVKDIEDLDKDLKSDFTLEEIAQKLNRTKKSIQIKTCECAIRLINSGVSPEKVIQLYKNKVGMKMLIDHLVYRNINLSKGKRQKII